MQVFISWSGEDSKIAAGLMKNWLPNVIQEVEPWVSTQDIQKGDKWLTSLNASLSKIAFGLLMVTKTNFTAPWLIFEAGAISNAPGSRVVPLLCNINHLDIADTPLFQFQAVVVSKEGLLGFITDINKQCLRPLPEGQLKATFEKWWPDFEKAYKSITFATEVSDRQEDEESRFAVIESVLEHVLKYLRRIEQAINLSVATRNIVEGYPEPSSQGLGRVFGGLTADEVSRVAASLDVNRIFSALTPDELSRVAAVRSENALKLARALTGEKFGRGMVDPKSISQGEDEQGNKDAPEQRDGK